MFAHEAHTQLDTKNLNVYINGAQILKDVNVRIPKNKVCNYPTWGIVLLPKSPYLCTRKYEVSNFRKQEVLTWRITP